MAYAFKEAAGVPGQVRDIAIEQVDKALDAIGSDDIFDEKVHALRKCCKKLRALLRLVRPGFDDYDAENASIKGIADQFSVARDAAVMVETLSGVMDADGGMAVPGHQSASRLLVRLRDRAGHLRVQMGEDPLLGAAGEQLQQLRNRVQKWDFEASGAALVLPGLKKGYAKFRKGLDAADGTANSDVVHNWRKAAKVHWYHMRLFEKSAPDILSDQIETLDDLCEMLGDHHNLAVLNDWIETAALPSDGNIASIRDAIAARQARLLAASLRFGRQFSVENPLSYRQRMAGYWKLLG